MWLLAFFGILFFIWIFTKIFQWLWNITMPQIFNLSTITFWEAVRLLILAGILFGSSGTNVASVSNNLLSKISHFSSW